MAGSSPAMTNGDQFRLQPHFFSGNPALAHSSFTIPHYGYSRWGTVCLKRVALRRVE